MAVSEPPVKSPTPVIPDPLYLVNIYSMYYRQSTSRLESKNFRYPGGLQAARKRAEDHCAIMGYKFMWVQPMISDLNKEEEFKLGHKIAPKGEEEHG